MLFDITWFWDSEAVYEKRILFQASLWKYINLFKNWKYSLSLNFYNII